MSGKPTILPYSPFSPKSDAEVLHKAVTGLGTTEKDLIKILTHRTSNQRQEICAAYQGLYKKDLLGDIKGDTSGSFFKALKALLQRPAVNDAEALHEAMKGLGTDEEALIEILFTRTNKELNDIKVAYEELFKTALVTDLKNDVSGDFQQLLLAVLSGTRDETGTVDRSLADADAKTLLEAGPKKLGTDINTFMDIFTTRNFQQLHTTFGEFLRLTKTDIETAISSEMSGDTAKAFLAIVQIAKDMHMFFAKRIYHGFSEGGKDKVLIRVLVSRSEKDLETIKETYFVPSRISLESVIKKKTSSDYQNVLLQLLRIPT